ncbi:putative rho-like GTP binding protein [Trypanosoma theileri]|uniref:Putative rho-like GTP binding protein n=1 Tax=Trypanosoma theileri TaxID=67003 RepID=A0A1X0NKS6_9TRYP|nr:putative rho-like GTP binding protein [Trypanosoma theileri]ORC85374.1 putative rho-like GTP binding protein [Trypanosoma theileri]
MGELRCKVILLGDGKVGKTCLLYSYANGLEYLARREDYNPTLLENYELLLPINESNKNTTEPKTVRLSSWDTAGQEEFDELRRMCYTNNVSRGRKENVQSRVVSSCEVSVFILCFAWDDPQSLTSVQMRWYREIRRVEHEMAYSNNDNRRRRPFNVLLCGTKFDLRVEADNRGITQGMVTREQAYTVQQSIKANALVWCSSKTGLGVRDVFHTAVLLWLQDQPLYMNPQLRIYAQDDSLTCEDDDTVETNDVGVTARSSCQLL